MFPITDEPLTAPIVDERPQLRQTPAKRGARVVGTIPEQITQALPRLW
jgi:hypothetical protein